MMNKAKAAIHKVGDKMHLTNSSRAPTENDDFDNLAYDLEHYHTSLGEVITAYRTHIKEVRDTYSSADKLVRQTDKIAVYSSLHETHHKIGLTDLAASLDAYQARCEKTIADLRLLQAEVKPLRRQVAERNKAGAKAVKHEKRADKNAQKKGHDHPKTVIAEVREERKDEVYVDEHERTLAALKEWKKNVAHRLEKTYFNIDDSLKSLYREPADIESFSKEHHHHHTDHTDAPTKGHVRSATAPSRKVIVTSSSSSASSSDIEEADAAKKEQLKVERKQQKVQAKKDRKTERQAIADRYYERQLALYEQEQQQNVDEDQGATIEITETKTVTVVAPETQEVVAK